MRSNWPGGRSTHAMRKERAENRSTTRDCRIISLWNLNTSSKHIFATIKKKIGNSNLDLHH